MVILMIFLLGCILSPWHFHITIFVIFTYFFMYIKFIFSPNKSGNNLNNNNNHYYGY